MCKSLVLCFLGTLLITVSIAFKIDTEFSNDGDRIVGGSEAEPGQYPHQVSLRTGVQVRHHICGGSIISDRWVITAAHCVSTVVANLVIVAGAHHISEDGVTYKLNQSIVHENYNRSSLENDIALLQTTRPISFSENVLPVALSNKHVDGGVRAVVSGWGRLVAGGPLPNELQHLQVYTIDNDECRDRHTNPFANFVHNSTLCAFRKIGQGACHGDSGGPLIAGRKLVGLVSWGNPCARGYPDGYTRVSSHIDWISNHTGINVV